MGTRLKPAVAAIWLLALPAALPSDAGATDAPVPRECQNSNLSPQAQARCDFIARTPNLCVRSGLSGRIQQFCDQRRFAGEPHFNLVKLARNGAVRSIHLIRTETGQEVFTGYPYGTAFAASRDTVREVRIKTEDLAAFVQGRPTPAATLGASDRLHRSPSPGAAPSGFASGLPIGWNESTGATPGQCFNYTINTPSNNVEQASFSSKSAASSTAEQINVSATVSGASDGFMASDTFSYSDQWSSSTNSSNQYYNFYSLYTLDSTVSSSNPLNAQGQGAGASFSTLCGSQYMSAVTVGMVATISIDYGSTSSSTQTDISNSLSASEGLDSISTAVSSAYSATNSSSYFEFTMNSYGGGTAATTDLNNAFAATNAAHEAYYALCAAGSTDDCTTFSGNMGSGASNALSSFNGLVSGLSGASDPDLSFFETFPSGVAGADTPALVTTPIPIPTSEVLQPYASQLEQYVTLLNQIATLNNRVGLMQSLVTNTPSFNPETFLDLLSYLDPLENIYTADRSTLLGNLESCLAATSANVTTVCGPIIDNQATDAFEYYATLPTSCAAAGDCFFAQQNTLALQYVGVVLPWTGQGAPTPMFPIPLDVIYIDELPPFAAVDPIPPIAGQAAFVGFADRTYWDDAGGEPFEDENGNVQILALEPGEPLSTDNVSSAVRVNPADPSPFTFWLVGDFGVGGFGPTVFTTNPCTPTFARPCAIDYEWAPDDNLAAPYQNVQIEGLF